MGSQGNPIRPIRDSYGLSSLIKVYWEDSAPLPQALLVHMKRAAAFKTERTSVQSSLNPLPLMTTVATIPADSDYKTCIEITGKLPKNHGFGSGK